MTHTVLEALTATGRSWERHMTTTRSTNSSVSRTSVASSSTRTRQSAMHTTTVSLHRIAILALVLIAGAVRAQDANPIAALQNAVDKAFQALNGERLEEARELFRQTLQMEFPEEVCDFRGHLHFAIATIEAKRGRTRDAIAGLNAAVEEGFQDWEQVHMEPAFSKLLNNPKVRALIQKMKEADRRKHPFEITEWVNPDPGWAELHAFNPIDEAQSKELRDTWKLADVVAGRKSVLEQQLALTEWVHNQWQHGGLDQPSKPEALTILAEVTNGRRFRCVEYSITLSEVLQAMGFPARTVGLSRDGVSHGVGKGHVVTEAWNDELGKWIVLDGQNNGTW